MDKIKYFIFLFTTLLLLSCGDSINVEEEVDANYLVTSQVFQQYVTDLHSLMAPLSNHLNKLTYKEVVELENELFRKFEFIEESKNKAVESDRYLSNIVKLLGYDSVDQYTNLVVAMNESLSNVLETYPELNKFYEFEPNSEMEIALGRLLRKSDNDLFEKEVAFFDIKRLNSVVFLNESSSCENTEGLSECLSDAQRAFYWRTARCVVSGAATGLVAGVLTLSGPVGGTIVGSVAVSACQAVTILWHEDDKQACVIGNC